MRAYEIQGFVDQTYKTQKRIDQYREAAESVEDEVDKARLLAAARAVEINALEWLEVADQLARLRPCQIFLRSLPMAIQRPSPQRPGPSSLQ